MEVLPYCVFTDLIHSTWHQRKYHEYWATLFSQQNPINQVIYGLQAQASKLSMVINS